MIEIKNLTKEYKIRQRSDEGRLPFLKNFFSTKYNIINAVTNLSMNIKDGEIVGYIGTNGAGKSTTIKMMTGILSPTSGSIKINGLNPFEDRTEYVKDIGVIFGQKSQLFWDIPVIESLKLLRKIYNTDEKDFNERLKYFTSVLGLSEILNQSVRELSLGQKMRAEFAAAFLHSPKIVFLDEPTIGLDVNVKHQIRKFIKKINKDLNTTVILTTHDLQDIEELCDRVIIINKGQKIFDGSIKEIYALFDMTKTVTVAHDYQYTIRLDKDYSESVLINQLENGFSTNLTFSNKNTDTSKLIKSLLVNNTVKDLTISNTTLEEIIRTIYNGEYKK